MDAREREIKEAVIKTVRALSAVLGIWLVGWFGFSYAWVLGSFFLYLLWKNKDTKKKKKLKALRAVTLNEQDVLMQIQDLPSWVSFPDVERAEWLNQIIRQMWPFLSTMISDILKQKVEPEIQKKLPSILRSFNFVEVDLGNQPLKLGGIKVYTEHVRPTEIVIDAEIIYAGDAVVKVGISGITAGISDVQLRGIIRVEINPLLSKPPLIGGITLYFLDMPEFDFDLTNFLNILDIPGLSDIVKKVLEEVLESFMVLPNRIIIPIGEDQDLDALKFPMPLGALQVDIIEASELVARDIKLFKKNNSDPYVVAKVGRFKHETKTIDNTLSPKWKDESFMIFVDSIVGHQIYFEIFDKDPLKDGNLGYAEVDLADIAHSSSTDLWLPLKDVKTGSLHVNCGWFNFSDKSSDISKDKESTDNAQTCLFVKLDNAKDLPATNMDKETSSPFVEITVGNKTVQSKTQRNTKKPVWEELHSFFVINPSHETLNIQVLDADADQPLGTLDFKIGDLIGYPDMKITQQFPLQNCFTNGELQMSLELKALVSPLG